MYIPIIQQILFLFHYGSIQLIFCGLLTHDYWELFSTHQIKIKSNNKQMNIHWVNLMINAFYITAKKSRQEINVPYIHISFSFFFLEYKNQNVIRPMISEEKSINT